MKPTTHLPLSNLAHGLLLALCALSPDFANADAPAALNPNDPVSAINQPNKKLLTPKAKVRDPLKVEPALAVKDSPTKEINLPGVLTIAGENALALDPSRALKVSLNNGGSQTIYLSATEPNRIQLPFLNPRVIGTTAIWINKEASSNNVFLGFNADVPRPVQVFLEGPNGGPVFGFQAVPKNIPSQTIIVQDDAPAATADQRKASKSNEYITAIQALVETVSLGSTPNGYSVVDESLPAIVMNGLMVEVNRRYSNREGDIYVYGVSNPGLMPITIRESEFDGDTVKAVSIFPKPVLAPGEKAQVIVVARKALGN